MTWLQFIIGCLATFRLATMFAQEKGPGRIFCILRKAPKSAIAREGLSCPLCLSVYMGLFVSLVMLFTTSPYIPKGEFVFLWLAFSGASVCLSLTIGKEL